VKIMSRSSEGHVSCATIRSQGKELYLGLVRTILTRICKAQDVRAWTVFDEIRRGTREKKTVILYCSARGLGFLDHLNDFGKRWLLDAVLGQMHPVTSAHLNFLTSV
jgi:hypothetical protein